MTIFSGETASPEIEIAVWPTRHELKMAFRQCRIRNEGGIGAMAEADATLSMALISASIALAAAGYRATDVY